MHCIENGAISRTVYVADFGTLRRGIAAGSKSGGKYLFSTLRSDILTPILFYQYFLNGRFDVQLFFRGLGNEAYMPGRRERIIEQFKWVDVSNATTGIVGRCGRINNKLIRVDRRLSFIQRQIAPLCSNYALTVRCDRQS